MRRTITWLRRRRSGELCSATAWAASVPQQHAVRAVAGGLQARGRGGRGFARRGRLGIGGRGVRSGDRQQGSRPGRVPAELPAVRGPHGRRVPGAVGRRQAQAACRAARAHRAAVRGAAPADDRVLGLGDRLRRQQRQPAGAALAGDARLRLPPLRDVPRGTDLCVEGGPARRPRAGADGRARGRARSARPSSRPRPTSSTRSTSTATDGATSSTACRTCSPRRPSCSQRTAGSAASRGCRRCACRPTCRGTRPTSRSSIRARNGRAGA